MAERFCKKCGYSGPDQLHQRPNGTGQCGYLFMPTAESVTHEEKVAYGHRKFGRIVRAAINLIAEVQENHETKEPPLKYSVPYGAVVALQEALTATPEAAAPPPAGAQQAVATRIAGEAAAFRWLIANRITEDENGWLQLRYSTARQGKDHPDKQWVANDIAWEAGVDLAALAAPAAPRYGFLCYSCSHEWESNTPVTDCPSEGCGTTNNFNVDHLPAPAAAQGAVSAEDQWIEQTRNLNCPVCNGSGHVEDVLPQGDAAQRALLELLLLKDMKDKWEAEELSGFAYKSTDNHRLHNEQRANYLRRKPLAWEAARKAVAATPAPEAAPSAKEGEADMYLLQDSRSFSYVGNCPTWWKQGGGYTTRIDEAERFTLARAMAQHRSRDTDIPWALTEIEPLQRPTIDLQDLPRSNDAQRDALKDLTPAGGDR